MSETLIYKGRGDASMYEDYIDFINYVFGFNGNGEDFIKLLPKLYKPEYSPCENNYVVTENGKLKAAIGVFPRELNVMGEKLVTHGIGNVAVHPYSRSKGYMRELMGTAVRDMIDAGADFSELGGQRQRYGYFSYENASVEYRFNIDATNIRHCFVGVPKRRLEFLEVNSEGELLDNIIKLHAAKICHIERSSDAFLDIAHSWSKKLYAILDGDKFIGYYIGSLTELTLADTADAGDVIRAYINEHGDVSLKLPAYETALIEAAEKICDDATIASGENYTVFHFKKVISAFLKLKAATVGLLDGSLSFRVNGIAGTECFKITVNAGKPEITESDSPTLTLEHREAVSFFFGAVSPLRVKSPLAAAWFPLPLYVDKADHV